MFPAESLLRGVLAVIYRPVGKIYAWMIEVLQNSEKTLLPGNKSTAYCQMVAIARLSNKIKIWHTVLNYSQGQTPLQTEQSKVLLPLKKLTLLSPFGLGLLWYLCSVLAFCIERKFTPIGIIVDTKRSLPVTLPSSAGKISAMCRLPFFSILCKRLGYRTKTGFWK